MTSSLTVTASGRRPRHVKTTTATAVTTMARLASMNGAPRIAPMPMSFEAAVPVKTMAMMGMSVSGSAVPTAARTLPTAPSPSSYRRPNHSTPLVKSSADARMIARAMMRSTTDIRRQG